MLQLPRLRCWLCNKRAIYTCPACDAVSCSLECCLKHKEVADCDGALPDFISLQNYDYNDLYHDVVKIERIQTYCNASISKLRKLAMPITYNRRQKALFRLYEEIGSRVVFMPRQASKSMENVSTTDFVFTTIRVGDAVFRASLRFEDTVQALLQMYEYTYQCTVANLYLKLEGAHFRFLEITPQRLNETFKQLLQDIVIYEYPEFVGFLHSDEYPDYNVVCRNKDDLYDEWLDEWMWQIEGSEY